MHTAAKLRRVLFTRMGCRNRRMRFMTILSVIHVCKSLSSSPFQPSPHDLVPARNGSGKISHGSVLRDNFILQDGRNGECYTTTSAMQSERTEDDYGGGHSGQSWQHWCDPCACGFNKLKSYEQHKQGKRHTLILEKAQSLWEDYLQSDPVFYDAFVARDDVIRAWSLDLFMDGLQARSRSSVKQVLSSSPTLRGLTSGNGSSTTGQVDPGIRLSDLSPTKRAALWRHLHTSDVPNLAVMVSLLPDKYVRVKELLESLEVFGHVQRLMKRRTSQGQKARNISQIYDIGCGHGLVGMLCAVTFPFVTVHSIDIVPRESFQAQREAFRSAGATLDNLNFVAGDLSVLSTGSNQVVTSRDDGESLLLCVHGCKALTHESIELAEKNQWSWLSIPCCLQAEHHLDASTSLKVSDDVRFAMLCGAIAAKYQADTISTIDRRITGRGIVLTSSSPRRAEK